MCVCTCIKAISRNISTYYTSTPSSYGYFSKWPKLLGLTLGPIRLPKKEKELNETSITGKMSLKPHLLAIFRNHIFRTCQGMRRINHMLFYPYSLQLKKTHHQNTFASSESSKTHFCRGQPVFMQSLMQARMLVENVMSV